MLSGWRRAGRLDPADVTGQGGQERFRFQTRHMPPDALVDAHAETDAHALALPVPALPVAPTRPRRTTGQSADSG
ncbi:hypothetical protein ACVW19_005893 [Streptomyces sp. TE5632]